MDAARWQRIQQLFEMAVDLPTDQQELLLARECAGDTELASEVRSLIRADDQHHSLLDNRAADLVTVKPPVSMEGRMIGPYRVVRQVATGGMGAVFLAERADGQFQRQVALKLIKRGMDSEEILQRFRGERQILANLNHPNIAGLIDGGLTDDSLPWFTMEYVDGEPIDVYCDRKRFTVRERLELFLTVCRAVEHAQRNLVVHRDLKPSNIMVTEDGTVKLLDFGIAKVLGQGAAFGPMDQQTRTGWRVMTPGYAAPEQVRGDGVSTATDVYSLGVVLYELLTGQAPYELSSLAPLELERVICHTDPQKPSASVTHAVRLSGHPSKKDVDSQQVSAARRTQPSRLRRQLAGDLDNICLMALRKEPARRYQTAGELAEDIGSYLAGRPVRARKDSWSYRAEKFFGRHRVVVIAGTLVLAGFVTLVIFYTARLSTERDRARAEADKAQQVSDFLISMFEQADPNVSGGKEITARAMLDQGAMRINDELADQPELQASMLDVIGSVYYQLGDLTTADSLYSEEVALQKRTFGDHSPEVALALHGLANVAGDLAQFDRAESLYREALEIDLEAYGEEDGETAAVMNDLASILKAKGQLEDAEPLFEKALAVRTRIYGEVNADVAHSMNHLGGVLHELGRNERAEAMLRKGLEIRKKLYGETNFEVVASMGKLASFLLDRGSYDESGRLYTHALDILHQMVGEDHPYVGGIVGSLANVRFHEGDYLAADSLYRHSLAILRRKLPEGHVNLATPMVGLGKALLEEERPSEAEPLFREALALRTASLPEGHWTIAQAQAFLGMSLADQGKDDEAIALLDASLEPLAGRYDRANDLAGAAGERLIALYGKRGETVRADSVRALLAAAR